VRWDEDIGESVAQRWEPGVARLRGDPQLLQLGPERVHDLDEEVVLSRRQDEADLGHERERTVGEPGAGQGDRPIDTNYVSMSYRPPRALG
jgi:hypothetical protein